MSYQLVNPTLLALIAELVKMTSVDNFCKNSTLWRGIVKEFEVLAPTDVEMLTTISPPVSLQILTQVAELRLVAVPVVVGVETWVSISFVICIIINHSYVLFINSSTDLFPIHRTMYTRVT
jgi:hypothetical protein